MLLFSHLRIYVWSPLVYIPFDRHGPYPAFEKAGISPDFVLKKLARMFDASINESLFRGNRIKGLMLVVLLA
jgi:hypothetical protein